MIYSRRIMRPFLLTVKAWPSKRSADTSTAAKLCRCRDDFQRSMLRLEQRDAVRIARRRHLPHIGVDIRRLLVGDDGRFIRRHLICRVTKLIEKTLEWKLRSRDARAGHPCALACLAVALITTHLKIERLAVLRIARRRRTLLGTGRRGSRDQARQGENDKLHGSLLNAAA